ncbi:MAG: site-specific integrase [Bacteroidaceae bacterium]
MGVTIGKRKLKNGGFSLFLDLKSDGERKKEGLHIVLSPGSSSSIKKENKEKELLAKHLRAKREMELIEHRHKIKHFFSNRTKIDMLKHIDLMIKGYSGKDNAVMCAMRKKLSLYATGKTVYVHRLDEAFCEGFYHYLQTTLHGNTAIGYFRKFKRCLQKCVEAKLIDENPAQAIKTISSNELVKDILSSAEIQLLANAPCLHLEVKRAFLFACHSGLRWCDVKTLQYSHLDFANSRLTITQRKVEGRSRNAVLHLDLNATAIALLSQKERGEPTDLVFRLPGYSYTTRVLTKWTNKAGIQKHITFHCARHSFITNLIVFGANIRTASALAGHSSIRHTERYIHIVDELKRQAVDNLPQLNFPKLNP